MMNLPKVMLVRHAEKPGIRGEPPMGFDEEGRLDPHSLTIHGWQRAGALISIFEHPRAGSNIDPPSVIYAAKRVYEGEGKERLPETKQRPDEEHLGARAYQTVLPLAKRLNLDKDPMEQFGLDDVPRADHTAGTSIQASSPADDAPLIRAIKAAEGPVLISWEHKRITDIVLALQSSAAPIYWDGKRFDMIWILTPRDDKYELAVEVQNLLPGDALPDPKHKFLDTDTLTAVADFNARRTFTQ